MKEFLRLYKYWLTLQQSIFKHLSTQDNIDSKNTDTEINTTTSSAGSKQYIS